MPLFRLQKKIARCEAFHVAVTLCVTCRIGEQLAEIVCGPF